MECLDGQTLKYRIQGKALSTDEILDLATQVAEGDFTTCRHVESPILQASHFPNAFRNKIPPSLRFRAGERLLQECCLILIDILWDSWHISNAERNPINSNIF